MYCIECGAQIPENSKFCSHCGHKQTEGEPSIKEKVAENIIKTEIVRQVVEERNKTLDYEILKKAMGWYIAWVLLHLGLLLIFSASIFGGDYKTDDFWPFGSERIREYDFTEFLVYTIFPLGILIVWSMVSAQNRGTDTKTETE